MCKVDLRENILLAVLTVHQLTKLKISNVAPDDRKGLGKHVMKNTEIIGKCLILKSSSSFEPLKYIYNKMVCV